MEYMSETDLLLYQIGALQTQGLTSEPGVIHTMIMSKVDGIKDVSFAG